MDGLSREPIDSVFWHVDDEFSDMLAPRHLSERLVNLSCRMSRGYARLYGALLPELDCTLENALNYLRSLGPKMRQVDPNKGTVRLELLQRQLALADHVPPTKLNKCAKLGDTLPRGMEEVA